MRTPHRGSSWFYPVCGALVLSACSASTPSQPARPSGVAGSGASTAVGSGGSSAAIAGATASTGSSGMVASPIAGSPVLSGQAGVPAPVAGMSAPQAGSLAAGGGGTAGQPTTVGPAGTWPAADPGKTGPFATVTETMIGPGMAYTMYRPKTFTQRSPVITWGNGTGTTPPVYAGLLNLYASHGFIVIASNSENVGQGTPPPMLDGVTWVLEQDMTAGSTLYQHVDRDHIGATGHSQGAIAASSAGADPRIKTIAPIETLVARNGLHGPALGLCGSMDTTVPCSLNMSSFSAITDQPVMYAELKSADHTNWIYTPGGISAYWVITTAWFRVQLMNDTALRPMFYGTCTTCQDTATWITMRKMMDQ